MTQGFLQFVPFYSLYYLITRWDRVGKWFMKALAMIPLAVFGGLLVLLGLWLGLTREEKEGSWLQDQTRPPVESVVRYDSERV